MTRRQAGKAPGPKVYIFNHIMKCGGLSLSSYLFNNIPHEESVQLYIPGTMDEFLPKWRAGHYDRAGDIYVGSHFGAGAHRLFPKHEPAYLTMLREPFARFVSSYKMSMDIGVFPDDFTIEDYFEGSWPDFMTLVIGDGSVAEAKRRLTKEYSFVGILEENERSVRLLAHALDLPAVAFTHANKSFTKVGDGDISADLKKRFARANAGDAELYRHGVKLFRAHWARCGKAVMRERRPVYSAKPTIDALAMAASFLSDTGRGKSFLTEPYDPADPALPLLWSNVYRMGFLPLLYTMMKKGRYGDLRKALANLRRFHENAPAPLPLAGEFIAFFENNSPRGAAALAGKLAARLPLDLSGLAAKRLGARLPMSAIGYSAFMDTGRMLELSGRFSNSDSLKKKIEEGLLDD